jgi:NADH-quinone oxidoreductase subunit J
MSIYTYIFYLLAAVILAATAIAVTRRNMVHAILYLVISFFGSAMLFYLLGAPFLAALEIIIYAGAIMILFLFIIMMINIEQVPEHFLPTGQLVPAVLMVLVYAVAGAAMFLFDSDAAAALKPAVATPQSFGHYVLTRHWLMIEVVSMLLLVALVGALYLGRQRARARRDGDQGSAGRAEQEQEAP